MRSKTLTFTLVAAVALTACSGRNADRPRHTSAIQPHPGQDTCQAAGYNPMIGKPGSILDGMRFSVPIRLIKPGQAVTMDFNPQRVNFFTNEQGIITSIRCA